MIRAVLFDMDGVITDSERYYINGTYQWLKQNGFQGPITLLNRIVGANGDDYFDYLGGLCGLDADQAQQANDSYFLQHPFSYRDNLFGDIIPLMSQLKQMGIKIGVCSLSYDYMVKQCLSECGLTGYVDQWLSYEDCDRKKPDPLIYLMMLDRLKVNEQDAIVIEDSRIGIEAGKRAGMFTVARKDHWFGIDQSYADLLLDDLREVLPLIKRWNNE